MRHEAAVAAEARQEAEAQKAVTTNRKGEEIAGAGRGSVAGAVHGSTTTVAAVARSLVRGTNDLFLHRKARAPVTSGLAWDRATMSLVQTEGLEIATVEAERDESPTRDGHAHAAMRGKCGC